MKYIHFKIGSVRVQVSYGKPKTDTIRAHDLGHRLGVGHLPTIGKLNGTIPYSTLQAKPKL